MSRPGARRSATASFAGLGFRALAALALVPCLPFAALAQKAETPTASGTFKSKDASLEVGSAYAYPATSSMSDGPIIRVVVTNSAIDGSYADSWLDRQQYLEARVQNRQTALINFEFSPTAEFGGVSYYLGSGNGCGFCSGPSMKSTVRLAGGRLVGKLGNQEKDRSWDITLDVPVATEDHGPALPAGGGDPGRVYLAFAAAVKARDAAAIGKLLDAVGVKAMGDAEKKGDLKGFLDILAADREVDTVKVDKGFAKGDTAVLAISGEGDLGKRAGQVLLRKEKDGWRVVDEILVGVY